jgi:hypothetical protein
MFILAVLLHFWFGPVYFYPDSKLLVLEFSVLFTLSILLQVGGPGFVALVTIAASFFWAAKIINLSGLEVFDVPE